MKRSLANLQHAYARLAPRERLFVAVGAAALSLVVAFLVIHGVESAKARLRGGIDAKERQLERVQALRAEYLELKQRADDLTAKNADRSPNWLYSTLEPLLKKNLSRDKIHSMDPSSKPIGDQYVEDSVNVEVLGVTLPQIVALLYEVEQSPDPMHVSRLQMKKRVSGPYEFDVVFSVSSIKAASS
jgi:Type II secretion system (T2SS), protein M